MNPFEQLADRQISAPAKAKHRAAERRAEARAGKGHEDSSYLLKEWHAWRQERVDNLLAGPHGKQVAELLALLRAMSLEGADGLVEHIRRADWLRNTTRDVRLDVLSIISEAITRLREKNALLPFDDPLPGEPLNAFLTIKEMLQ